MFIDRNDAGRRLGEALAGYAGRNVLVLAIPRGGAPVGFEVARRLDAELSVIVSRKLPFPDNPESGFGAVAEDGSVWLNPLARFVPDDVRGAVIAEQEQEIRRRVAVFRNGEPLPPVEGRTVILVDDGIAMGSTMRVSVMLCRKRGAGTVVVAVPVTGAAQEREFRALADDIRVLTVPPYFSAVAQVYERWYDLDDAEVLRILARFERERGGSTDRTNGNEEKREAPAP